jgi:hypothetical protein
MSSFRKPTLRPSVKRTVILVDPATPKRVMLWAYSLADLAKLFGLGKQTVRLYASKKRREGDPQWKNFDPRSLESIIQLYLELKAEREKREDKQRRREAWEARMAASRKRREEAARKRQEAQEAPKAEGGNG